jgi:hypothetical protein
MKFFPKIVTSCNNLSFPSVRLICNFIELKIQFKNIPFAGTRFALKNSHI